MLLSSTQYFLIAFYAIQTLRQIFKHEKIPTVETLKKLIDQMAYYKRNSLQLYEHTFEFEEYKQLNDATGCLTKEDLLEIGAYRIVSAAAR